MKKLPDATRLFLILALVLHLAACAAPATSQPRTGDATQNAASTDAAASTSTSASATANPSSSSAPTQPGEATANGVSGSTAPNIIQPNADAGTTTATTAAPSSLASWPQWRGPNRDGNVSGFPAPQVWPKALKEEWKVTVGVGHASPVVSDGKIYVFARQGEEETLVCLDAATGKQLWRSAQPVAYEMNPAARGHGKGPKSTPVVSNNRVYTLGIAGLLSAHDARTGKLLWRKDFSKQYPTTSPLYGTAMSPVVEKNLLIAHVGGHERGALTAFDAETGAVRWAYDADPPAYSSPILVTLGGERQVVTFTQKEFVGVSAANGKLLWKLPAKTHYDTNCATAVTYKDMLVISLEDQGMLAIRPVRQSATGAFTVQEVWRNADNVLYMNSPVLQGNLLFGMSARKKGQFFCLDADTGKTIWQSEGRMGENASILNLSGTLLFLTNDANLIVLPASAKQYAPLAQYTVANSPTWAHPVVLGDRILVKDETTLASLSVRQ
ncbi:MAG TPA: PQQ-binding-like beta-propeller repeat protein [Pyrinomonadaceae bacterium]|jgi:outer membrane protein assembly factor BamB